MTLPRWIPSLDTPRSRGIAWCVVVLLLVVSFAAPSVFDRLPLFVLLTLTALSYLCLLGWLIGTLWIIKYHRSRFPWWVSLYVLSSPMFFLVVKSTCCFGPCHETLEAAMAEALTIPIHLVGFMTAMVLTCYLLKEWLNRPAVRRILGQSTLLGLPCFVAVSVFQISMENSNAPLTVLSLVMFFLLPLAMTAFLHNPLRQKAKHYVGLLILQFFCGILLMFSLVNVVSMAFKIPLEARHMWQNFKPTPPTEHPFHHH